MFSSDKRVVNDVHTQMYALFRRWLDTSFEKMDKLQTCQEESGGLKDRRG